jgi:hypothetical protein
MPTLYRVSLVLLALAGQIVPVLARTDLREVRQAATSGAASAKTWLDRRHAVEEYLRSAAAVKVEDIGVGVTKPRRASLAPGGLVDRMAWKTIKPGFHQGYWESYKSEIAAYELDKLLALDMIPPTVERTLNGEIGAAVMWVAPTKSFKELGGPPSAPADKRASWNRQLVRAKMFDNLICNLDPNLGNWLVDPSWNLIVIDHTRSFTTRKDLVHEMGSIDRELWTRMQALTVEILTPALGKWIGAREMRAMVDRRDRMRDVVAKMVAAKGEAAVFVP